MNFLQAFKSLLTDMNSWKYRVLIKIKARNSTIGKGFRVYGKLYFSLAKSAIIVIEDNVVFKSSTKYNYVGISKCCSINVGKEAELRIGKNTGFSGVSLVANSGIHIGMCCQIGGNANIWDTDFHPLDHIKRRSGIEGTLSKPISIGNDVFIGANSTILKGVSIGECAIVGASSVVSKSIAPHQIWAGNPAKFIKVVPS